MRISGIKVCNILLTGDMEIPADDSEEKKTRGLQIH